MADDTSLEAEERADGVRRYFAPDPVTPDPPGTQAERTVLLCAGALGVVGVVLLFAAPVFGVLLCLAAAALGGSAGRRLLAARKLAERARAAYRARLLDTENRPADGVVDGWLEGSLRRAVDVGWRELGMRGPFGGLGSAELQLVGVPRLFPGVTGRVGADGRLRLNAYQITVLYLTDRKLCVFQCELNMASGGLRYATTHEFLRPHLSTLTTGHGSTALPVAGPDGTEARPVTTLAFELGAAGATVATEIPVAADGASVEWLSAPSLHAVAEIRRQLDWTG
ncbi:hypothetical protein EDD29_1870 [Actinocorallia herbida]|uniref:Uncharacterized protein n=1 Tax=Actinocorallia herbida TaxID=58109 RepID=A0A3N1CUH7_9ACTN|nr:hypothetical protein [Actinocorallia herbida]ROO84348.1 hypothetical protein EDD29_1870 [Actinocorallia herbida]